LSGQILMCGVKETSGFGGHVSGFIFLGVEYEASFIPENFVEGVSLDFILNIFLIVAGSVFPS